MAATDFQVAAGAKPYGDKWFVPEAKYDAATAKETAAALANYESKEHAPYVGFWKPGRIFVLFIALTASVRHPRTSLQHPRRPYVVNVNGTG